MENILLLFYEAITVFIPFILLYLIFKNKFNKKNNLILLLLFFIYILAVLHITGTSTIYEMFLYDFDVNLQKINFTPLKYVNSYSTGFPLNILMFVPFGFFLPLIWGDNFKSLTILVYGFLFSLLIEISQLFNNRATDIDDLIANTIGAVLGYIIYKTFVYIFNIKVSNKSKILEPGLYIVFMFLGKFLFFNEYSLLKVLFKF